MAQVLVMKILESQVTAFTQPTALILTTLTLSVVESLAEEVLARMLELARNLTIEHLVVLPIALDIVLVHVSMLVRPLDLR